MVIEKLATVTPHPTRAGVYVIETGSVDRAGRHSVVVEFVDSLSTALNRAAEIIDKHMAEMATAQPIGCSAKSSPRR